MTSPVLQFKRGAFVNLPGLRVGEPGFTTDKYDLFVGLTSETSTNQFFGSGRYWGREDGSTSLRLKLVDKDGTNSINLKAPNTLSGVTTYTLPATPIDGYYLRVAADGTLSWSDAGSTGGSFSNTALTGITSISGNLEVTAESNFTGIATFSNVDINDGTIDGVVIGGNTPDEGYFTLVDTDVLVSDNSTLGIATATDFHIDSTRVLYDDGTGITLAGIQTIDATTKQTLEEILALEPNDFENLNVVGIATIGGLLDANAGLDVTGQTTLNNDLSVTGVSTFTGALDANGGADISGHTELDTVNVSVAATFASATVSDLTSGRVVLAGVGGELQDSANLTFDGTSLTVGTGVGITQFSASVSTGTSTSSVPTSSAVIDYVAAQINLVDQDDDLSIAGDIGTGTIDLDTQTLTVSGTANEIVTSVSGQTVTVGLTTDVTIAGDLRVNGGDILSGAGSTAITLSGTDVTVAGDLTIGGSDIKAADGTTALTLTSTTGAVTAANDLTVQGNLYVNGSTTQVNTNTLTVEDRTIELGTIQAGQPASTTWDLAVLFNYGDGVAKKAGVVWEASGATKRFQFTTDVNTGADGGPADTNLPSFTVANFAPIEISELWVNNSCTGGAQQVIGCVNSELQLQNIVVDGGVF